MRAPTTPGTYSASPGPATGWENLRRGLKAKRRRPSGGTLGKQEPQHGSVYLRCGWRQRSRCSVRSRRAGAFGGSCCGAWRRSTGSRCSSVPATTYSSCSGSGPSCPVVDAQTALAGPSENSAAPSLSSQSEDWHNVGIQHQQER